MQIKLSPILLAVMLAGPAHAQDFPPGCYHSSCLITGTVQIHKPIEMQKPRPVLTYETWEGKSNYLKPEDPGTLMYRLETQKMKARQLCIRMSLNPEAQAECYRAMR